MTSQSEFQDDNSVQIIINHQHETEQHTSNTSNDKMDRGTDIIIQSDISTEKKIKKPRAKRINKLSEDQVRINHVTSEKRRREIIRSIYDELVQLVPDLRETENRSELIIYLKTINYIKWLYTKNNHLRKKLSEKNRNDSNSITEEGHSVDESLVWELDLSESRE